MTLSLIRGKHVVCKVTGPRSAEVVSDGVVLQRDGVIEAVGDYRELSRQHPEVEVIGTGSHIIMPGLVNDHFHVGLTPFQMGAPDLPLEMWSLHRIGALEPGRRADMVLLDMRNIEEPYLDPRVSVVDALVHRARGIDVDTVLVDGEVVLRNGQPTRVDKEALSREIKDALNRPLSSQEEERRELASLVEPHLRRFYSSAMPQDAWPFTAYNARS